MSGGEKNVVLRRSGCRTSHLFYLRPLRSSTLQMLTFTDITRLALKKKTKPNERRVHTNTRTHILSLLMHT